jgi:teichuronic acid exporter
MSSLKQKTVSGLLWSFVEHTSQLGITFVIGIILARLLSPREFGLIGLLTVFTAITQTLTDSGFGSALIRKKSCTDADLSTVFYFNLVVSLAGYGLLYLLAPLISRFYGEPQLVGLMRVLGVVVIMDSLTLVQRAILTKRVDFKLQTKISLIAAFVSGAMGIAMAYLGFGVWSLVARTIIYSALNSAFLWLWNGWLPKRIFSRQSFHELFSFGYKLMLSGLLNTIWSNIYDLVIGKCFSTEVLGYFTRARMFSRLPSESICANIGRVSYPVLSQMQHDPVRLKRAYKRLITSTMLVTFVLLLGMAAVAEPLVIGLVGEKWRQSVPYLRLLCFAAMLYPLHALNLNMLNVQGRSDLFLKLEIIKKFFSAPVIILGVIFGIEVMLAGMLVNSLLMYGVNSYWSGKLIQYPVREQIRDVLPMFVLGLSMASIVFVIGWLLPLDYLPKLLIQVASGGVLTLALCERSRLPAYLYMKEIVLDKVSQIRAR